MGGTAVGAMMGVRKPKISKRPQDLSVLFETPPAIDPVFIFSIASVFT
jgi:hypothetical protein